jgi:uncharacterized delta-60 repeat protein
MSASTLPTRGTTTDNVRAEEGIVVHLRTNFVRAGIAGAFAIVLTAAASSVAWSNPGDLDPTFSSDGVKVTTFPGYYGIAFDVVIQPRGQIAAVGFIHTNEGIESDFALVRYTPLGQLDQNFGNGGRVLTDFDGRYDVGHALASMPDGRIVAVGSSTDDIAVALYRRNGRLDPSFDGDGRLLLDLGSFDDARDVTVQDDGKVVIVGNDGGHLAVIRLEPDGTLDSSFGGGAGFVLTDFGGFGAFGYAVAIQPDGKILAAGYTNMVDTLEDFALARYLEDGTLDSSFGSGGLVTSDFRTWQDRITGLAIQADGKIVAAGRASVAPGGEDHKSDVGLVRYEPDGHLDSSFGHSGKVQTDFGSYFDQAQAVAIQNDGRIVLSSPLVGENGSTAAVARYDINGLLDASFGVGGIARTHARTSGDEAGGLALQPDGRIVVAGPAATGPAEFGFLALRFLSV